MKLIYLYIHVVECVIVRDRSGFSVFILIFCFSAMAEANETKTSSGIEQISRYSRDLLQRFMVNSNRSLSESVETTSCEEGSEEIELNLGLSMGGRFGVDKSEKKKLIRSSSIAECFPIVRDDDYINQSRDQPVLNPTNLIRTSSLPVETELEWRKRKELQTLRRVEAKRRRSEKQRNKDGGCGGGGERSFEEERREIEANLRGRIDRRQYIVAGNRFGGPAVVPPFGLPTWAAAAILTTGTGGGGGGGGVQGFGQPSPRGSVESQGGSSSGISDLESKPLQGSSSCGEGSLASTQSLLQERGNQETAGSSGTKAKENKNRFLGSEPVSQSNRRDVREISGKEVGANALEDMPCVFTKGDGPNGRRIEGILYRFGKGEEVRIMCVCHGKFLSPAEFVKHAGGTDVAHPLKHIVMNPNSSSSLL